VDHTGRFHFAAYHVLKCLFSDIRNNLGIHLSLALKMPKTMVLPEATRPRLPGIRRAPK
jgi:hypothetical protein